jgi:hypothetical protein
MVHKQESAAKFSSKWMFQLKTLSGICDDMPMNRACISFQDCHLHIYTSEAGHAMLPW